MTQSTSKPNIQSLPPKSNIAKQVRQAYLESDQAPKFVAMDFRDLELRVMAFEASHGSDDL
ncbi:hypothetical protein STASHLEY_00940 [Brevundimonas phage vB_BpoS-StAshley]|nr:hypothetical protein STASHLEY_00940 [Brevundimonas phage vB_BpoS-StAshley]